MITFGLIVGQGPTVLAVDAGGGCLDFFLSSFISLISPSLWETARYRLKYCLKGTLSPKQPTKQFLGNRVFAYMYTLWCYDTPCFNS